ncbi:MAG: dihydrodipicolinate synthase family protein [Halobacteriaceae archaeon]
MTVELAGTIPPMATPVTGRDGDVDHEALRAFTRRLTEGGVHGLFPCGSNGEFTSLTDDQRRAVIDTVADAAGDTPVLAGVGGTSVRGVVERARAAAESGADAAVVVTPYYMPATQDGLRDFFAAVADGSPLPVVLYDLPALVGDSLSVDSVVALADHDNVVGLKDSTGDLSRLHKVLTRTPADFAVLQGSTVDGLPSLDFGADGIVAGEANVDPAAVAEVYDAFVAGDRERSVSVLRERVFPINDAITDVPTIPALKHLAAQTAGIDLGPPLPPLPELSDDERETAERVL